MNMPLDIYVAGQFVGKAANYVEAQATADFAHEILPGCKVEFRVIEEDEVIYEAA